VAANIGLLASIAFQVAPPTLAGIGLDTVDTSWLVSPVAGGIAGIGGTLLLHRPRDVGAA